MTNFLQNGITELLAWAGLFITSIWTAYKTHKQEIANSKTIKANEIVAKELTPNHGSSAKDALTRIEHTLEKQGEEITHHNMLLKTFGHQLGEHITIANTQIQSQDATINELRTRVGKLE